MPDFGKKAGDFWHSCLPNDNVTICWRHSLLIFTDCIRSMGKLIVSRASVCPWGRAWLMCSTATESTILLHQNVTDEPRHTIWNKIMNLVRPLPPNTLHLNGFLAFLSTFVSTRFCYVRSPWPNGITNLQKLSQGQTQIGVSEEIFFFQYHQILRQRSE